MWLTALCLLFSLLLFSTLCLNCLTATAGYFVYYIWCFFTRPLYPWLGCSTPSLERFTLLLYCSHSYPDCSTAVSHIVPPFCTVLFCGTPSMDCSTSSFYCLTRSTLLFSLFTCCTSFLYSSFLLYSLLGLLYLLYLQLYPL